MIEAEVPFSPRDLEFVTLQRDFHRDLFRGPGFGLCYGPGGLDIGAGDGLSAKGFGGLGKQFVRRRQLGGCAEDEQQSDTGGHA